MGQEGGHLVRLDLDNSSMISSSPKSVARLIGVTVAGTPILTFVSHPASNITETISVLPEERDKIIKVLCDEVVNSMNNLACYSNVCHFLHCE